MMYAEFHDGVDYRLLASAPGPVSLPLTSGDPRSVGDVLADPTAPGIDHDEGWTAATLQNGWENFLNGYPATSFRKTIGDWVQVVGLVKHASATPASRTVFTLPMGYRPEFRLVFPMLRSDLGGRIDVLADGRVSIQQGGSEVSTWTAFNFGFRAA